MFWSFGAVGFNLYSWEYSSAQLGGVKDDAFAIILQEQTQ